ncbi:dihydroorotate dehydrogenase electron transfer subunit [Thermodesulfatator atlanticus]
MKSFLVKAKEEVAPGYVLLTLAGDLAPAQPGQFVMLRAWPAFDPLLARPFSIHDAAPGLLKILFQVRGRGTTLLAQKKPGDLIEVLGPLGRGFPVEENAPALLVAGGIGIAPFLFFAKRLLEVGRKVVLFYGARGEGDLLCLEEFESLNIPLKISTEDGSKGAKGLVTDLLQTYLSQDGKGIVYACGPMPMLSAVAEVARHFNTKAYVSLEAHMACGLGMCLGCTVARKEKGFLHVCSEGPVVPAEAVF